MSAPSVPTDAEWSSKELSEKRRPMPSATETQVPEVNRSQEETAKDPLENEQRSLDKSK